MLKRILIDSGIIAGVCGLFVGAWFLFGWGRVEVEKIVIVKQEPIDSGIKPSAGTDWEKLAKSKLRMSVTTDKMSLTVKCEDDLKFLVEKYTLKAEVNEPRYSVFLSPGIMTGYDSGLAKYKFFVGGDILFTRNFAKLLKIGAGVTYYNSLFPNKKDYYVGLKVVYGFDIK